MLRVGYFHPILGVRFWMVLVGIGGYPPPPLGQNIGKAGIMVESG
jgi:hypothetical protein